MRRRDFIKGLVATATAWPLIAHSQQSGLPVVGFLNTASPAAFAQLAEAFQRGLNESSYFEGRNVLIEYRWAEGHYDRLPGMAADLVGRKVAVIASTGGPPAVEAAAAATSTVPIVFLSSDDVLKKGIIASLNRPGGNITGVAMSTSNLAVKCFEFINEMLQKKATLAMLINPNDSEALVVTSEIELAAKQLGSRLTIVTAANAAEIDLAFAKVADQHVEGLIVEGDAFFTIRREQIVQLAARNSLPAIYMWSEFPASGGLMSYGNNLAEGYRQVGGYTGRILKGERPSDLPVMQPTRFELVINLQTAKSLGIAVPQALLVAADRVIE